jgi:hypothetical protein
MQVATYARLPLFWHISTKLILGTIIPLSLFYQINNIIYVSINKQLTAFQKNFQPSISDLPENGLKHWFLVLGFLHGV